MTTPEGYVVYIFGQLRIFSNSDRGVKMPDRAFGPTDTPGSNPTAEMPESPDLRSAVTDLKVAQYLVAAARYAYHHDEQPISEVSFGMWDNVPDFTMLYTAIVDLLDPRASVRLNKDDKRTKTVYTAIFTPAQ
jgi:hypothetical protein